MKELETVKSHLNSTIQITLMSWGDYRVIKSSRRGYTTRDFDTLQQARTYANKLANITH